MTGSRPPLTNLSAKQPVNNSEDIDYNDGMLIIQTQLSVSSVTENGKVVVVVGSDRFINP